jgi:hypothetical protein
LTRRIDDVDLAGLEKPLEVFRSHVVDVHSFGRDQRHESAKLHMLSRDLAMLQGGRKGTAA